MSRPMTCVDFERRLEGWIDGELTAPERAACERHLTGCARCHDLADLADLAVPAGPDQAAASTAADSSPEPPPELLPRILEGVLERTTGSVCGRVRHLLVPLVDGERPAADRELLELHLETCIGCRELRAVLLELSEDLPRLAELDPRAGFVDGVLARTSRIGSEAVVEPSGSGLERLRRRLRRVGSDLVPRLVRRPRFAWEAAYVLVLLSMPLIVWAEAPGAAAEELARLGRTGGETIASTVRSVSMGAAKGADSLGSAAGTELRTFGARLASSLQRAGQTAGEDDPAGPAEPNHSKEDAP